MPHITFLAELENIEQANSFMREHIDKNHPKIGMIELAIEEILVNIINYAYKNPESLQYKEKLNQIEFGVRKIRFDNKPYYAIRIRDWGCPFDPFENAESPDTDLGIEERPIGGLGVHLVKSISNHQCYCDDDGSNIVEIYFSASGE